LIYLNLYTDAIPPVQTLGWWNFITLVKVIDFQMHKIKDERTGKRIMTIELIVWTFPLK